MFHCLVLPSIEINRVLPNLLRSMANHHGWSMVNFSASKMHLPHHRRTNKFPWSPVAAYLIQVHNKSSVALPGGGNDWRSKPFSQDFSLQNDITPKGYARIPHEQTSYCYHCILLASPLVNCHAGVNEFNTHIVSSPQHVTRVLITC